MGNYTRHTPRIAVPSHHSRSCWVGTTCYFYWRGAELIFYSWISFAEHRLVIPQWWCKFLSGYAITIPVTSHLTCEYILLCTYLYLYMFCCVYIEHLKEIEHLYIFCCVYTYILFIILLIFWLVNSRNSRRWIILPWTMHWPIMA